MHAVHAATIPNWYSEINVTFYSVTLARTIWLPDDGPRTETCRSVFNVLMCKFYKFYMCAVVCSALHTEHIKTPYGQNVKPGDIHSNHQALNYYLNHRPAPHPSGCPIILRTRYRFSYRLVVFTAPASRFAIPPLTCINQERVHRLCNIAKSSTNFS